MPRDSAQEMRKAEKEIGKNIPEGMKGLDTEDVGEVGSRRAPRGDDAASDASASDQPADG